MPDAGKITQLLLKKYPSPKIALVFETPLDLLVATILSAQCTDKRVNIVTAVLFRKYRKPEDYASAKPEIFETELNSINYYKNKARMIIQCSEKLIEDFHGKVPGTLEELVTLPGIGRKTANVILGGAFGRQAIPVDTHVLRVSNRLGLAHSDKPDKVEQELMKRISRDKWTRFSRAIVLHGRETCKARKPLCPECILLKECNWPEKS
jgi:endonuclease-3